MESKWTCRWEGRGGAGALLKLLKCLLHKHGDLSSNPRDGGRKGAEKSKDTGITAFYPLPPQVSLPQKGSGTE